MWLDIWREQKLVMAFIWILPDKISKSAYKEFTWKPCFLLSVVPTFDFLFGTYAIDMLSGNLVEKKKKEISVRKLKKKKNAYESLVSDPFSGNTITHEWSAIVLA